MATGDYGFGSKNMLGLVTAGFTTDNQSLITQSTLGAIGSGGTFSYSLDNGFHHALDGSSSGYYSTGTNLTGLLSPNVNALSRELGFGRVSRFFIQTGTAGLLQRANETQEANDK